MENFLKSYIFTIIVLTVSVVQQGFAQQRYSSSSGVQGQVYGDQVSTTANRQWEECGVQDKDELPDMHAAAPWAAALFYVEGDIFENQLKPQYLNTAIFITKNLAIASGSTILAQQESVQQTKLQLYYGHRASGKQTLIRVRKVEALSPPRQPLALKVDNLSTSSKARQLSEQTQTPKSSTQSGGHADLYLLHLESSIEYTSFSRPLCMRKDIFTNKNLYYTPGRSSNKVFISGYASKNETAGPHVVYFSGDREWKVQSWDADNIKVMMKDQQVSYGFLPKHFNPGSAFAVKIDNNFYLAGILLRSKGAQTTIRSLEKYVDMIMTKGVKSHEPPPPQPSQNNQDYLRRPVVSDVINNRPPPQYSTNPGSNIQQQQQQPYYPPNTQYSNTNNQQQASNTAGAQITYLREVEASEIAETSHNHQKPGSGSGGSGSSSTYYEPPGSINSNRRTTTTSRSTTRYDSIYLGGSTLRPSLSRRPQDNLPTQNQNNYQQQQQQPQIQQDPYSQQSQSQQQHQQPNYFYGSTTPSAPQYVYHPDSQRPVLTRPENVQSQSQPQLQPNYYQQQQPPQRQTRCSQNFLEGVDIECLTRQRGVSTTDCIKNAPANTKIRMSCKPHYVPLDGDKLIEKTCDSSGNWLPRKAFACKLDCGSVERSVPYIVHGSKVESEKVPWHAALFKHVNGTSYTYICGATLIQRSILVTAAHCVYNGVDQRIDVGAFKVVVGAINSDLYANRKDPQAQEFDIKEIKVNEHYNPRTFEADIALIQLDKPVVLTEYVKPVCFPFPSDENKQVSSYQLSEGNFGVVVGFGTTENWSISKTLRMATLPVVSVKDCTTVLERLPSSSQYCAGYTNGTSVCEGDSGGAHIFKDQISKRYFVQGIISHGNRKESGPVNSRCDHEKYTVFTKVGSFAEWVKEAVYDLEYDYNRRRRRK